MPAYGGNLSPNAVQDYGIGRDPTASRTIRHRHLRSGGEEPRPVLLGGRLTAVHSRCF